jgi:hypothetical protein
VADYQSGPLGRFYYPATGGSSSLTNLINTGSRLASAAGLYHFTTTTNQVKEATSQVDIGHHYVALDVTGLPVDTDGDGIPDYLEDRNGNGRIGDLLLAAAGASHRECCHDGWRCHLGLQRGHAGRRKHHRSRGYWTG